MESDERICAVRDDDIFSNNHLFKWLDSAGSVLVIGLSHPEGKPELDWWDGNGTPGNRLMVDIMRQTRQQIEEKLKLRTHILHYYIEKRGVFLKDAAVLAGLGCIGKNNLLVSKVYGYVQMEKDVSESSKMCAAGKHPIKYCRECEFACPIGKMTEMKKELG